ncbi:erythromycin biosynthesis sensory transduction protein eryC1 (plasmid) [Azospirillum baldaniorum]|uniref:Aminotransferase, StrS family n=1 Tax=Azospirillum baldaniorum TaxID=1064539 RepID=A0A9P1K1U5_9PROT|nr:DegT/DnrJ/EryC1/StrS family aminotransferase [Azospirillum baldaniorum]AWJ93464.1 erythromycin biosynthesis sensory transduction protein eryC1 [Azospirillum baldaniorum]TWA71695.1 dTDP-4-amino-4,6-dideoxygalactose transaminase [Azospirillum brasilense]CCD03980.1 putative aminotransferase, StrS family [Azospirillum baldaniorum]
MDDSVPQTDPAASYRAHRDGIDAALRRALDSGWYILGQEVKAFEAEFAPVAGTACAVGVANGTDAIVLALEALGIGRGDAVVTVSHTAVATVAAIEMAGATPVLADVDAMHGLDPESLEAVLRAEPTGGRIRAVIPVHLYGQPVDLDAILEIAGRHDIAVIEDASQAHGALWRGRPVGGFGNAAAFSLYPTKNLGALGDAGVLTTSDAALVERVRELRQYGWRDRFVSAVAGRNSRLDEVQAAVLRAKLPYLATENTRRQQIAALYDHRLAELPLTLPRRRAGAVHVFHQYVVEFEERDALRMALTARGIATGIHYPVPIHRQPAYAGRVPLAPGGLPRTESLAGRILSLPMYPQMTDRQVARVAEAVAGAFRAG